jgi:hypothetical protein
MTASVRSCLATNLDRRDEAPNVALAEELARRKDKGAIAELVELLKIGKIPEKQDAIKVLYEVGAIAPELLGPHIEALVGSLEDSANRVVWGALTGLSEAAKIEPKTVAMHIDAILTAADNGSVIAKDRAIYTLIALKTHPATATLAMKHLLQRLEVAGGNQLPMYAERIHAVLEPGEEKAFRKILSERLEEHFPAAKRKRLEKVMGK